ncbi:MAG: hypothetical protein M1828_007127 [Chrysothrix sp. TS-e1954]|nr:MAG: hypothetical protein M1828_007127 [Chrysothrix sp. TS-e1954]
MAAIITSPSLSPTTPLSTSVVVTNVAPPSTTGVVGSSLPPSTTALITSVVTTSAPNAQSPSSAVIVVSTSFSTSSTPIVANTRSATSSSATSTSSSPAPLTPNGPNHDKGGGGLSPAGTTAIAVVIPVVVVALLLLGALFWWRRRKQRKTAQETRRQEVEEYGYNPNEDPTLPAVAAAGSDSPEMSQDTGGYRGWGNNAAGSSNRKQSTNLSSGIGMAVSDDGQRGSPGSPDHNTVSDGGHSADPLVDGAVGAGAMGAAGAAAHHHHANGNAPGDGVQRGPSNASSSYSNAARTDNSDEGPAGDLGYDTNYSQYAPYRPGATQYEDTTQPVIRDVSARRNTKIENPSVLPKQGNSGISQNF